MLVTVRWLLAHGMVQWYTDLCYTLYKGTSCYIPRFWWGKPDSGPQKWCISWCSHQRGPFKTSGSPPWCAEADLCTFSKGLVVQAAWESDLLCPFVHHLWANKRQYCTHSWFTTTPSSSTILLFHIENLLFPLIYHSLVYVGQFSLMWFTSKNILYSFFARLVIRYLLELR